MTVMTLMQLNSMWTAVSTIPITSHSVTFKGKAHLQKGTSRKNTNQIIKGLESYHREDPRDQSTLKLTFILTKVCYLMYICTNVVYVVME